MLFLLKFSLFCIGYAIFTYWMALRLRRYQRRFRGSNLREVLGLTKDNIGSLLTALYMGLPLIPLFPMVFAVGCWFNDDPYIFRWDGWASISIVGLISFNWGTHIGRKYLEQYWQAIDTVSVAKITGDRFEFPHSAFTYFEDYVLNLTFKGIEGPLAVEIAKAHWLDASYNPAIAYASMLDRKR